MAWETVVIDIGDDQQAGMFDEKDLLLNISAASGIDAVTSVTINKVKYSVVDVQDVGGRGEAFDVKLGKAKK